jgi:membrane protease YdiL (CAAX protease family)
MNFFFNEREKRLRAGWRLLIQLVLLFFMAGLLTLGFQSFWQSSLSIATAIPQSIGFIGSVWIAARLLDKRSLKHYGLSFNSQWIKDFNAGIIIAAVAIGSIFFAEWLMGWLSISGYGWEHQTTSSFIAALFSSFTAMLLVGFHEELFSRGYQLLNLTEGLQFPSISPRIAVAGAVIITSVLFGLLHAYNPNASNVSTFNIILAGIVLAIPFVLTGKLGLSAGLHFSWNFTQGSIFGFPVSGSYLDTSFFLIDQKGMDLWTGGAFGPEAGLMGIAGMAIMLGGSYVYILKSGYKNGISSLFLKEYASTVNSDEQAR